MAAHWHFLGCLHVGSENWGTLVKKFAIAVAYLVAGALLAFAAVSVVPSLSLFSNKSENRNTQVIEAIMREEQVVLLSLGIQGIDVQKANTQFRGFDIPGSARTTFVQYAFKAKLGIEGGAVTVEKTGETSYLVTVPEFIFIGHSDESFELVAEDNGLVSFVTPKIDAVEVINAILSDEKQDEYVEANVETLQDQAQVFYTTIISSIDPDVSVQFKFLPARR